MLLGKPFAQFVEESPISVMMRGVVEYAFEAKRLNDLLENTAEAQYTRTLHFSDRHGFWGRGFRYPPREAETSRFWSQLSW